MTSIQLDDALSKFVSKIRKQNGTDYSNLFDTHNSRFVNFTNMLDARLKYLTSKGIGTEPKQADPITTKDEEILWNKGQLGAGSSQEFN